MACVDMCDQRKASGRIISPIKYNDKGVNIAKFVFYTDLKVDAGQTYWTSETYILDDGTSWQILLNPNFVDENGTKFLSTYLQLLDSPSREIETDFCFNLLVDRINPSHNFYKGFHAVRFSKENPCFGFQKFAPIYFLGNQQEGYFFGVEVQTLDLDEPTRTDKKTQTQKLDLLVKENVSGFDKISIGIKPTSDDDNNLKDVSQVIHLDASVTTGNGPPIKIDSERLSFHSSVFKEHFIDPSVKQEPFDVSKHCSSRDVMEKIVDFCHCNGFHPPETENQLILLLAASKKLDVPSFTAKIQSYILENLSPETFMTTVHMDLQDFFDESAPPIIVDYLLKNFDELVQNELFRQSFEEDIYYSYYLMHVIIGAKNDDDVPLPLMDYEEMS